MMRKALKKVMFSLILVFSLVIVNSGMSLAASAVQEHVHQLGSIPSVERVISEEIIHHFYYTGTDGRTYDYQTVIQNCLWYYSCYCGYRGNYYTEGRRIYRDVLVS